MANKKIKDEAIISALMSVGTVRESAKLLGCTEQHLSHRMQNEEFKELYNKTRKELLSCTTAKAQSGLSKATDVTMSILENEDIAPQVRLNACEIIFRNAMKMTDKYNYEERLSNIEKKLESE